MGWGARWTCCLSNSASSQLRACSMGMHDGSPTGAASGQHCGSVDGLNRELFCVASSGAACRKIKRRIRGRDLAAEVYGRVRSINQRTLLTPYHRSGNTEPGNEPLPIMSSNNTKYERPLRRFAAGGILMLFEFSCLCSICGAHERRSLTPRELATTWGFEPFVM
jgi:hypothetical protein